MLAVGSLPPESRDFLCKTAFKDGHRFSETVECYIGLRMQREAKAVVERHKPLNRNWQPRESTTYTCKGCGAVKRFTSESKTGLCRKCYDKSRKREIQ